MAERQVNLRVAVAGEKEYKAAISEMNMSNKVLASEMKKLQAEYQGNTDSMEFMSKKGEVLQKQLDQQQDKVAKLREALKHASSTYGENSETAKKWQVSLNEAEAQEYNLKHAIEQNTKAMEGQDKEMQGLGDTVETLASKLGIHLPDGAKKALNGMNGLSAGTVAAMGAAAAAIAAVAEGVKQLGQLTLDVAAQVDDYITQSTITGIPTEILQAWDYAAPLIDVDAETITDSMAKIIRSMNDARDGSGAAAEAFQTLGISVTDADGNLRSSQEVFFEVIDALGKMTNETERNALAQELLGKNAQELNPLILAGSGALSEYADEAERVGYILSEDQVKALGEADDAYQRLQLTIEGQRRQLAAELAPTVTKTMTLFADMVEKAGKALIDSGIIDGVGEVLTSLSMMMEPISNLFDASAEAPNKLSPVADALYEIADLIARINDGFSFFSGLFKTGSIFTMKEGLQQIKNSMGFGYSSGNPNSQQKLRMMHEGTWGQYASYYGLGHNAGGTDYWRGGLTWVGENGPELVDVPRGSRIYNATDSANMMGDVKVYQTFNINVDDLQDLQKLILWGKTAGKEAQAIYSRTCGKSVAAIYPVM